MEMMRVGRIYGPTDVRLSTEPKPQVKEGESLVRVTAVGLCGSDLHWYHSGGIGDAVLKSPLVLGHEFGGVVEGGELDGMTVAVDPARPCLNCVDCHEGNRNLCNNVVFAGHGANDGGLREYVAWPTNLLHPLPQGMDGVDAALLEPLGVAVHAWDLGKVAISKTVVVVGCGPIGICLIKLAKATGATTIIAVEKLEHRKQAALAAGADEVFDPSDVSTPEGVKKVTAGRLIDYVFEAANLGPAAQIAIDLVKAGGTVVLAGIPDDNKTVFTAATARRKGLTIKISRRMGEVYPRVIDLVDKGLIEIRSLATHEFKFEDLAEGFATAEARIGLKVLINPSA